MWFPKSNVCSFQPHHGIIEFTVIILAKTKPTIRDLCACPDIVPRTSPQLIIIHSGGRGISVWRFVNAAGVQLPLSILNIYGTNRV